MDEQECAYCNAMVPNEGDYVPKLDDDDEWARLKPLHGTDCEWIDTRAHRIDLPNPYPGETVDLVNGPLGSGDGQ